MKRHISCHYMLLVLAVLFSTQAIAQSYKCKTPSGELIYQQIPCAPGQSFDESSPQIIEIEVEEEIDTDFDFDFSGKTGDGKFFSSFKFKNEPPQEEDFKYAEKKFDEQEGLTYTLLGLLFILGLMVIGFTWKIFWTNFNLALVWVGQYVAHYSYYKGLIEMVKPWWLVDLFFTFVMIVYMVFIFRESRSLGKLLLAIFVLSWIAQGLIVYILRDLIFY